VTAEGWCGQQAVHCDCTWCRRMVLWGGYAGTETELSFTTAGYIYEIDRDVWRRVPRSPEGEGGAERKSGVQRGNTRCIRVGRGGSAVNTAERMDAGAVGLVEGRCLYVFGGWAHGRHTNAMTALDTVIWTWRTVESTVCMHADVTPMQFAAM
jgi:hypothetical protein